MGAGRSELPSEREIVQERVFDAPRKLVWEAWTNPRHVDHWWGPNGFRNQTLASDFRVGGTWRFVMHGPDGKLWQNWIRYEEIEPLQRLVYAHGGGDGGEPNFHVTITFADAGEGTRVTMRSLFPSAEAVAAVKKFGAVEGGFQTLARLAGYLPHLGAADEAMVLTRVFDAPPRAVFLAWSTPQALAAWWGPKHFTAPVCEIDFRAGGAFRIVMRGPDGGDYPFSGRFREIVPNARIVFDGVIAPGVEVETTVTFVEEDGKTLLTVRQTRPIALPRAAQGQMQGWSESLEKLAPFVAESRA
jgi:uncharacterized protein YndB with AHSA1/START domain